ncbi:MAG: polysaccharide biosynthesis protein [Paludibacteraceae bacterium]|nr:polysaccharide biosynthesis protein [Paludibacteraceae bacterium]
MKYDLQILRQSDIFSHLSSMRYLPRWSVLILDLVLCTLAFWFSIWIGNGLFVYHPEAMQMPIWEQYIVVMIVQISCFWLFHTYAGILRYSTFVDTIKSLLAVFVTGSSLLIFNVIWTGCTSNRLMLNTVLIIYIFVAFLLLFCLRVGIKTIYETIRQASVAGPKVLIYGTQSAGLAIAKMLISSGNTPYHPVGFITNEQNGRKYRLIGLHVFPLNEHLFSWMKANHVEHVIISPLKLREINPSKDVSVFLENNIKVLSTPTFTEFSADADREKIGRIDAIQIEDLLERPTIKIDTENVNRTLNDKIILVTGAAGSIGSELVRQVITFRPKAVILVEQAESPLHDLTLELRHQYPDARLIPLIGNVRERERIEEIFNEYQPDIVFHAAAYKHVPLMEDHPNEAIHANVLGTKNMADMAVKYRAQRFVMISTDKAVNPTNIMGCSKRIAEMYVQSLFRHLHQQDADCTRFITTRFGNVLGSNGSVIPYFKKQIAAGGPVTVTHPEIIRYFMTIPEACCLVLEAATLGDGGEIFVFDMGQPVKILNLAKNMIRLAGFTPDVDIPIVFTGLRPGEKLYEELLNQKETTIPTRNEKIMKARVREVDYITANEKINQLIETSFHNQPFLTVKLMKQLVPEFISNNSIYQQLDK